MDVQSGESAKEEVTGEGMGESEVRIRLTKRRRELSPETR